MAEWQVEYMAPSELSFDLRNPRLPEFGLTDSSTESEVVAILWEAMDVRELVMSIAASGFFRHEPLMVVREGKKTVVIEGNRRLAAVRVILDPKLASELVCQVPELSPRARQSLDELPVIGVTRKDSWKFLGYKHVNGPAKWTSYAKARYIAQVHREFDVALRDIAQQIGDTHQTVQRLYRGLRVVEQAEEAQVFNREDRYRNHFAFSHLYTGLSYEGIIRFLDLASEEEEADNPVPAGKVKELGELCLWLFGSRKASSPPQVVSQNPHLRQLSAVVENIEAVGALRAGYPLPEAFEMTRPAATVFEECLLSVKRDLQKARGMLSTGYDGGDALLRIAESIAGLAEDLYQEMSRKRGSGKGRRSLEES